MPQTLTVAILIGEIGLGGAERQLYNFLKHSNKTLFTYHVIVLNRSKHATYDDLIRELGCQLWRCPDRTRGIFRRVLWITRVLRQISPTVIHSWSFYTNPYALLAGILAAVPVRIGSLRNQPGQVEPRLSPMMRWLAYRGHALIVNSRQARDAVCEKRRKTRDVYLVENGIEIPDIVEAADLAEFGIAPDQRVVGNVGNLQRIKNHRMFIDGMRQMLGHVPDVRCLIVGQNVPTEPHMYDELQEYIRGFGLTDKIILTGVRRDVLSLMKRFDVFCLTSFSEGTPNVVLEAMAMGCPVIATSVGDVPYVIEDGKNGLLVHSGDTDALAKAVIYLLENKAYADTLAAAGQATVQRRFGCERMAREIESIYTEKSQVRRQWEDSRLKGILDEQ